MLTPSPNTPATSPSHDEAAAAADWYLAYTKPQQEHIAELNLSRQGYATYLPLYKHYKISYSDNDCNNQNRKRNDFKNFS